MHDPRDDTSKCTLLARFARSHRMFRDGCLSRCVMVTCTFSLRALNLHHRMSPTRLKCISYIHASQRYLGRFPRSSGNSNVAPVRTPTSWDHCYPSAMPLIPAPARIYLVRVTEQIRGLDHTRTELVDLVRVSSCVASRLNSNEPNIDVCWMHIHKAEF